MKTWLDIVNWLSSDTPIESAYASGELKEYFPEVHVLFGIPQPAEHHPEIDCGVHTILVLEQAKKESSNPAVWFSALCHDLGKGLTPANNYPKHINHEKLGLAPLSRIIEKYRIPSEVANLAIKSCTEHLRAHTSLNRRPGGLVQWLMDNDWYTNKQEFEDFLTVATADARGRLGKDCDIYIQSYFLRDFYTHSKELITKIEDLELKSREDILNIIIPPLKHRYRDSNNEEFRRELIMKKYNLESDALVSEASYG